MDRRGAGKGAHLRECLALVEREPDVVRHVGAVVCRGESVVARVIGGGERVGGRVEMVGREMGLRRDVRERDGRHSVLLHVREAAARVQRVRPHLWERDRGLFRGACSSGQLTREFPTQRMESLGGPRHFCQVCLGCPCHLKCQLEMVLQHI